MEHAAGRRVIPVHVAEANRPAEPRRHDGARDRADRFAAVAGDERARRAANVVAAGSPTKPTSASRDAPLAAVQDADDHFLSDVAALGQADGAILDAGFERDGVLVHVDAELRDGRLRRA